MKRVIEHLKKHQKEIEHCLLEERNYIKEGTSERLKDDARAIIDRDVPYLSEIDGAIKKLET
jgi:hypothetical protein